MHSAIVMMIAMVTMERKCVSYSFFPIVFIYVTSYTLYQSHELVKLKKKTQQDYKGAQSTRIGNIFKVYIFFSFKILFSFSRVFLELNQTLIVGYQVTRVAWLSSLFCARIMFLIFFGGGGGVHIITLLQTKSL